jgi:large subunit ribosomal protein L17
MNHRKFGKKLGRNTRERQALFKSLAKSVFTYGAIETTQAKAQSVAPVVEKLANHIVTHSQLLAERELSRYFQDRNFVKDVYSTFKSVFGDQTSNFTKMWKIKYRQGDDALIVKLSFVKPYALDLKKEVKEDKKKILKKETPKKVSEVKKTAKVTRNK